jgi:hypothetical protein
VSEREVSLAWQGRWPRGGMLKGTWKQLGSVLVFGESGFGKSTTQTYLACQAAVAGFGLVPVDPHGGQEEGLAARLSPLASAYWRPAAFGMEESLARILEFDRELSRRIKRGAEYMGEPWSPELDHDIRLLMVVDELNGLIQEYRSKVSKPLARGAQQGRKYGMFSALSGQWGTVQALGSSELRAAFNSVILHRMTRTMASKLGGLPEHQFPMVMGLNRGEVYVRLAEGPLALNPQRGQVPEVTMDDLTALSRTLEPLWQPPPLRLVNAPRGPQGPSETRREAIWAKRDQVMALFLERDPAKWKSVGDIAMIVQGMSTSEQGRARNEGCRVVEEIIRAALTGVA